MSRVNETFFNALPQQGHIYYKTHFRIEAGYIWGAGMNEEATMRFFDEMKRLFIQNDWTVEESRMHHGCPTVHKGGNHLYCHPMDLSGPCEKSLFPEVEEILSGAETCFLRGIDTYGQVYDVSDDQYRRAMDAARSDIEKELMQGFSTKQKHQYVSGYYGVVDDVAEHYRVPTLERSAGVISSDDVHIKYVTEVFQDLVVKGEILYRENERGGKCYRTTTGPERLELARRQAASLHAKIQDAQKRTQDQTEQLRPPALKITPDRGAE